VRSGVYLADSVPIWRESCRAMSLLLGWNRDQERLRSAGEGLRPRQIIEIPVNHTG
jgi:hypothetical protein